MKTPYKNIYEVLKLNRWVTISVTAAGLLAVLFSGGMVYAMYQKAMDSAFAIQTDGEVIPLKLISQHENREVEALAHLELFHQHFYGLEAATYEANLEKALWLGGSSVDNIYRQKKADGVYNRLLQYALVQKVISVRSKVDLAKKPYEFRTVTVFEINRGTVTDRYELTTTGSLQEVARDFPKNTHGLLITNFFENSLKRLSDEN
jgi:hypothetical protein